MKSANTETASATYLKLYNALQTVGWTCACAFTLVGVCTGRPVWKLAGPIVQICQATAALEIVHSATGLVRGSPVTAFLQWVGRANALFGILCYIPEVQEGVAVILTFVAWTIAEVVRYPWYLSILTNTPLSWLTWLRYSCFILLYPVGITGEALLTLRALPYIRERKLHSVSLPNAANWAFDYYWFCLVSVYTVMPFAFLTLYSHMLRQRKARLYSNKQGKRH